MKTKTYYLIPILFLSIFFACSTVEDDEPNVAIDGNGNPVEKVEDGTVTATDSMNFRTLLTDSVSKSWKTSLFTLAGSTDFTDCRLDDVMQLFTDGNYTYRGGTLCGAEDNQSIRNGSWELDYTNKKIYFDKGSSEDYEAEVIGLSDNELRVKGTYMMMEVRGLYIVD